MRIPVRILVGLPRGVAPGMDILVDLEFEELERLEDGVKEGEGEKTGTEGE